MTQKDRNFGQIMGINVISSSVNILLARVEDFITHNIKFSILTPNSELVLMAQNNQKLKSALNSADLPVPDTVGLNYASKFLFGKSLTIIPGRKLFLELIRLASEKGWRVFLFGGMDSEATRAALNLKSQFSNLKIESDKGPKLSLEGEPASETDKKLEKEAVEKINKFSPQILFVAFGNPKQEIWVHENLSSLSVGGAMAVGGAFRYTAGLAKLPPKWMEKVGLEWFWRLITEPKRIGRVFNAVVVFPLRVVLYSLTHS